MKGEEHSASQLVTDSERVVQLHQIVGSRFTNHGKLLVPTLRQYEALENEEGLLSLSKDFCRWLGYKPRHLRVSFAQISQPVSVDKDSIKINELFKGHPLTIGGLLALATLEHVFKHHHYTADDRFREVASIETGLGLWVINALRPVRSKRETIYHMLDGAWLQLEGIGLQAISASEYIRQFTIFTSQHCIFPEDYAIGLSRRNQYWLPKTPGTEIRRYLPEPSATHEHIKNANALWAKLLLIALILGSSLTFGLFLWTQRTHTVPYEQVNAEHSLQTIRQSLNECINKASEQQSSYDPNDLFMTRQIDATKSRCESLRNQYNDALDRYQKTYLKKS